MPKSIYLKKEGATPKNKIIDFLIVHQEFDYSLKDIAKFSKVGYTTLKKIKKELIKGKWIIFTRKVGKAKMYKLNISSPTVKKFIDFYWSIIDSEFESEEEPPKSYTGTTSKSLSISAKNL